MIYFWKFSRNTEFFGINAMYDFAFAILRSCNPSFSISEIIDEAFRTIDYLDNISNSKWNVIKINLYKL